MFIIFFAYILSCILGFPGITFFFPFEVYLLKFLQLLSICGNVSSVFCKCFQLNFFFFSNLSFLAVRFYADRYFFCCCCCQHFEKLYFTVPCILLSLTQQLSLSSSCICLFFWLCRSFFFLKKNLGLYSLIGYIYI